MIAIEKYFPCAVMAIQLFLYAHNSLSVNESFDMWLSRSTILIVAYEGLIALFYLYRNSK